MGLGKEEVDLTLLYPGRKSIGKTIKKKKTMKSGILIINIP